METFNNIKTLLRKYPVPVTLNMFGLVMAFTAFIIIMAHVQYERNFDKFHPGADCIFKVEMPENPYFRSVLPPGFAGAVINSSSHVEAGTLSCPFVGETYLTVTGSGGELEGFKQEVNLVSPGFFDVFGVEVTEGSRDALAKPDNVAIPESLAEKMFGNESPIGKLVHMKSKSDYFLPLADMYVGAVYKDFPGNTQLNNDILVPVPQSLMQGFGNSNFVCYLRLDNPDNALLVADEFNRNFDFSRYTYLNPVSLVPLQDVYFMDGEADAYVFKTGSRLQSNMMIVIAVLIVFIGLFNFINFYISLMPLRLRGINTRKILGAEVWTLRLEQALETACLVGFASVLAVGLNVPVSSWFAESDIIQEPVTMSAYGGLCAASVCGAFLLGMLAGIYPGYFVASFPMSLLLKGNYGLTPSGKKIKNVLLTLQYTISSALMIFIVFIFLQNHLMMRVNTNFDQDQLAVINLTREMAVERGSWLREALRQYPEVEDVAFASGYIGGQDSYTTGAMEWRGEEAKTFFINCSPNFFKVMGIDIIDGRDFTGDTDNGAIINSYLRDNYGVEVGTVISGETDVVGVCEEIAFTSVREEKVPVVFSVWPVESGRMSFVYVRLKKGFDAVTAVSHIRKEVATMDAAYPVDVKFYDQLLDALYKKEIRFGKTILCFSVLAVALSLIGVFAMVIFDIYYKRKEIALRKVFGAGFADIIGWGIKPYFVFVSVAFIVAAPISWMITSDWLENFVNRVPLSPLVFVLIFLAMQAVTSSLIYVIYATVAKEAPSDSLSAE